jgi:hypothetical protein
MSQVHRSAASGLRILGGGPAEGLLEQPEGVFQVESAQERLPEPVNFSGVRADALPPQPHRLGFAAAGQMVNPQADDGALDQGQLGQVLDPAARRVSRGCSRS